MSRLKIVYCGLAGAFSGPPLAALLAVGHDVRAVVMPTLAGRLDGGTLAYRVRAAPALAAGSRRPLPLLGPAAGPNILELAAAHTIPVVEVARFRDPATVEAIARYEPDAICVACFSRRIPADILRLPRLGCLNAHPSLLPDNRGPDPLFWAFRRGDAETGVTIHVMDDDLDTGPILLQERIAVADGMPEAALEHACAELSGRLLVEALDELEAGNARPTPQNPERASVYPWPEPDDYSITPDRPARWAFNFARGVGGRAQPISIESADATFRLLAALGYDAMATLDRAYVLEGDELRLRCAPGVFQARVAPWE
jgi:methionyl-tRNA formyltransferase